MYAPASSAAARCPLRWLTPAGAADALPSAPGQTSGGSSFGGFGGSGFDARSLPSDPPFTAFVGNVHFEICHEDEH